MWILGLLVAVVTRAEPLVGGQLPIRCRAAVDGKTALELVKPAPRPYPLAVPGRSLILGLTLERGTLSIELSDAAHPVSHGSWSGARLLARSQGTLGRSGTLKLSLGDPASDALIEVVCSPASSSR